MIQLNLLPDVKLEYIKARRSKRLVIMASAIVTGASVALVVMLFIATNVLQRTHLNNLNDDIEAKSEELKEIEGLNRILTVQNQLRSLDPLHTQKPAADRLGNYLAQTTPKNVTIAKIDVNFVENTISIEGYAPALHSVNTFIDTLKFTEYVSGEESGQAFTNVRLANFDRSDEVRDSAEAPVSYEITLGYSTIIFDNGMDVRLDVPATITTQSADRPDPDALFQIDVTEEEE